MKIRLDVSEALAEELRERLEAGGFELADAVSFHLIEYAP